MENKEKKDLELTAEEMEEVNGGANRPKRKQCPRCGAFSDCFKKCCPHCGSNFD